MFTRVAMECRTLQERNLQYTRLAVYDIIHTLPVWQFHGCCSHSFANLWLVHMRTLPLNLPMLSAKTAARQRKLGHLDPLPYLVLVEKEIQSISQGFTLVQHTMSQRDRWLNMWTADENTSLYCISRALEL